MYYNYRQLWPVWLLVLLLSGMASVSEAQTLVWGKRVGGTGNDYPNAITVDAAGNSYVTGVFSGTTAVDFDPSPAGVASLTSLGAADRYIAKYDPAGNYLWARPLAGSGDAPGDYGDIAVDGSGNCYITGVMNGTVDFNPDPAVAYSLTVAGGSSAMFLAKYDTDGNFGWAVNSSAGGFGTALTLDGSGNIFVTGGFSGTVTFGPSQTATLAATGGSDCFVARYSASGVLSWIQGIGGTGATTGNDIGVDAGGNVYVKGQFTNITDFDPSGSVNQLNPANGARFLTKYSADGNYRWAINLPNRTNFFADFYGLKVDNAGNSYVTGVFSGTADFDPSAAVASLSAVGITSTYIARYDANGNYGWAKLLGGNTSVYGLDIEADAAGNSYVTGGFSGTADFDPSAAVASLSATGNALFLAKYNSLGEYIQATKIDNADLTLYRLALDGRANVYITAPFSNTLDVDPSAGVTTLTSAGIYDLFIAKYTDCQSITAQPAASSVVCAGGSATVTVGVSGTVSGYQWFHNGTALSGQTTATLSLTNVQAADAGSYVVVVTNACISLTSTSFSLVVGPGIIHVTESGSGLQNGSSWANSLPGSSLQFAIDRAAGCVNGQVWVARGTYKPTSTTARDISFTMRNNVAVYGGFQGSETALSGRPAVNPVTGQPSGSTLSAEIGDPNSLTDNSYHVIHNTESLSLNGSAVLDGFVITAGYASLEESNGGGMYNEPGNSVIIRQCLFLNNYAYSDGGGVRNYTGRVELTDCVFRSNIADTGNGGGVANDNGSTAVLTNCIFLNNQANVSGTGGGIWNRSSRVVVTNNSFRFNRGNLGGGLSNRSNSEAIVTGSVFFGNTGFTAGGGIYNTGSSVTITGCTLESNSAIAGSGGGINHNRGTDLTITNCRFLANHANGQGGGISVSDIALRVVNSSFEANLCLEYGGAISGAVSATLTNCSFLSNSANSGGKYGAITDDEAMFINCVEFGNETGKAFTYDINARYSLFAPSSYTTVAITGTNNLTATISPFASTTGAQLAPCSPAINAGDPTTSSALAGTTDLAGNNRFFNGGRIDMGAYEFQGEGLPVSYTVLGSGTATCAASPTITLSGSQTGVSYQLRRDGINSGTALAGTGSALSFGPQSLSGVYTVLATGSCTAVMAGSATVVSGTLAASVSITPTSGTISCTSPALSLSAIGTGSVLWSTGASTSVISATAAGVYNVTLTNGSGCTATASAVISGTLLGAATVSADGPVGCGRTSAQIRVEASWATSFTLLGPSGFSAVNSSGVFSVTAGGSYTGLAGQSGCVVSNTVVVVEGGAQPTISSVQATGTLGNGACSVSVQGAGYGDRYVLTGPSGYVFSVVFRTVGDHTAVFPDVVKPGTYTLTVYSGNCVVTRPVTVTGTGCSSGR